MCVKGEDMKIACIGCGRTPDEIPEYIAMAEYEDMSPEECVIHNEGTYNPRTGSFYCTKCYIGIGMPAGKA